MDCRQAQELLEARLDAGGAQIAELDAHLAQCDACRALDARLQRLDSAFAAARTANDLLFAAAPTSRPLPMPLRHPIRPRRWALWSAAGLAAAACITLAVLSPWAHRDASQTAQTETVDTLQAQPSAGSRPDVYSSAQSERPAGSLPPSPALIRLTGESREKQIAVEQDTGVPRVRLVHVYALAPRKMPAQDDTEPQT